MKYHKKFRKNEQKATQLWNKFEEKEQEDFWTSYEAVLQKLKSSQITFIEKPKPVTFHPPKAKVILYSIIALLVFATFSTLSLHISPSIDSIFERVFPLFIVFLVLVSLLLWTLNSFKLDHQSLTIYKVGNIKYKTFTWHEIQKTYKKVYQSKQTYTKLVVVTKSKKYYYLDTLSPQRQSRFYKTLQVYAQNSTIKKY